MNLCYEICRFNFLGAFYLLYLDDKVLLHSSLNSVDIVMYLSTGCPVKEGTLPGRWTVLFVIKRHQKKTSEARLSIKEGEILKEAAGQWKENRFCDNADRAPKSMGIAAGSSGGCVEEYAQLWVGVEGMSDADLGKNIISRMKRLRPHLKIRATKYSHRERRR